MTTSGPGNFLRNASVYFILIRDCPHQVAQKSIRTGFSRYCLMFKGFPLSSSNEKGAQIPIQIADQRGITLRSFHRQGVDSVEFIGVQAEEAPMYLLVNFGTSLFD
jgi:hypothetical protein